MREEDWTVLAEYLSTTRDEIGLRDWYLVLKRSPPADLMALGSCEPTEGRKHAYIRVCSEFRELSRQEQRHVIIHELLHCHAAHVQHLTGEDSRLHKLLGMGAGGGAIDGIRLALEYAIDGIADGIADRFPEIPWTTPDPTIDEMENTPYVGPVDRGPEAE